MLNYKSIRKEQRTSENIPVLWLDLAPNTLSIKGKIDKLDCIRIKNFCSMKGHVNHMKEQATE